jgi:hypothetical protein
MENSRMRKPVCIAAVFRCVSAVLTLGILAACHNERTTLSWNSPRMQRIKSQWDSISETKTQDADVYEQLQNALGRVLTQNLTNQDLHQLAESCETLPVRAKDRSKFANAVLGFMAASFVDAGDRESLVKLLSTRFPTHIVGYTDIEFCLAVSVLRGRKRTESSGKTLTDPILILREAYSKCRDPHVRHEIAAAVRRAFAGLGIHGKDDDDFVKNAFAWYEKEKGHLVVNPAYAHNAMMMPAEQYETQPDYYEHFPFRHQLLFVEKPAAK